MKQNILEGLEGWKKYALIYAVLLVLSHISIWLVDNPIEEENGANNEVVLHTVLKDQTITDEPITIQYQDIYKGQEADPTVILLLPGGVEGPEVFEEIIPHLSSQYRLIVPHLPGFGNREDDLPAYSFETLAVYTNQLLDKLELKNLHVLGYGLGGASAIFLAHDYPEKVQSLSLVSSIGVQELELLGSYRLNHALHGLQLATVWLLHNAIPHFGLLQLIEIDVSYAKSHYESDQRPIRSHLKQYEKPMLILHGKEDPLVPLAAAQEHHRIVPQSELILYNADHDLIEVHSDSVAQDFSEFIQKVESGNATTADDVSPERIQEAQKSFSNVEFAKLEGLSLFLIMFIIMLGTFFSEDLTCIGAGLLAARGLIGFWPATFACFAGIFIADMSLYLAGRSLGRRAVYKAPFKWILNKRDLEKSEQWFRVRGPAIIIGTRFLPGSRLPVYFSAGILKANFWMFLFYFLLAAIVWTPLLVGISQLLGNELLRYFSLYQDYAIWIFLGGIILLVTIVKIIIPVFSYKGRRLLVSRYRRITQWQNWPSIILYMPVFFYTIYLGIKYRCLTLFTATNPAIHNSGFAESKSQILELFGQQDLIAQYKLIPSHLDKLKKKEMAEQFMSRQAISFPVVLKLDVGQGGQDVEIIKSEEDLGTYFTRVEQDVIIQEYLDGQEYMVFYYQMPDERKGHIFSIATVELLSVKGDGQQTVEELILNDDRTVTLAKYYLKQNEELLFEVPDEGEEIPVVELGVHAKGAVFRDRNELISEVLTDKINNICKSGSGFYFGRLDIKATSEFDLKNGNGIKIIEINGVTSESANIFDNDNSFPEALKILFKQWRLAFEIGEQNRKQGVEVVALLPFVKRIFQYLTYDGEPV